MAVENPNPLASLDRLDTLATDANERLDRHESALAEQTRAITGLARTLTEQGDRLDAHTRRIDAETAARVRDVDAVRATLATDAKRMDAAEVSATIVKLGQRVDAGRRDSTAQLARHAHRLAALEAGDNKAKDKSAIATIHSGEGAQVNVHIEHMRVDSPDPERWTRELITAQTANRSRRLRRFAAEVLGVDVVPETALCSGCQRPALVAGADIVTMGDGSYRHVACAPSRSAFLDVVFDGPPGPTAGRFVEVEDPTGKSVDAGRWIDRGLGMWALRIPIGDRDKASAEVAATDGSELTRIYAADIARGRAIAASFRPDAPSYLAAARSPEWRPHAWVVDAVLQGYRAGRRQDAGAAVIAKRDAAELERALTRINELETKIATYERRDDAWRSEVDQLKTERDKLKADYEAFVTINHAGHDRHLRAEGLLADARKQIERIGEAHWRGVEMYRTGAGVAGDLPPERAGLVVWLLEQLDSNREIMNAWETKLADALDLKPMASSTPWLLEQVGKQRQELSNLRASHLRIEKMHLAEIDRKLVAQGQLERFTSTCADQAIQIAELRTEISQLREDARKAVDADGR